ncbi:MAG: alkaline phosphatase family protein [Planctomycetota bacterium]|jgi:arylsulfatase A-like enzyme
MKGFSMRYQQVAVTLVCLLIAFHTGCAPPGTPRISLADDVKIPDRQVLVFLVDGMDRQRTNELLEAGMLPNIEKIFVQGGIGVEFSVAGLPSLTYPNCTSLITGLFPGHHGIVGNFWFDRDTLTTGDYMSYKTYRKVNHDFTAPTLYDLLSDRFTLNIQGHTRRGVTESLDNSGRFSLSWILGDFVTADARVIDNLEDAAALANRIRRWPSVIMTYYPGVDEIGHRFGLASGHYNAALVNIDNVVGWVKEAYRDAGFDESVYYVLVSDHGMEHVYKNRRIDILKWLRDVRGLKLRTSPIEAQRYADRYRLLESYDAVATVDAGRVAMVYLKGKRGWPHRPQPKEVFDWITAAPAVYQLPEVGMVFASGGDNHVRLFSRNGEAVIERKDASAAARYRIAEYAGDPLRYRQMTNSKKYLSGDWYTSRQWLAATTHTQFPDCVPQAVEMFDSSRTGDVVLMASEHANFNPAENGGHGSCLQSDMRTVMYFAGPQLPQGRKLHHARLVDVMPTILGLLGQEHRLQRTSPIDGINLADQLRKAH